MLQWDYKTNKAKLENESASKIQTNLNFRIVQFAKKKKKKKNEVTQRPERTPF
jgi:hypothetical protein